MGQLSLTKIFKQTLSEDAQFWSFSTDPLVQNKQDVTSKAHRSSSNLASSNFKQLRDKKDKDDADFVAFTAVMDQIHKILEEISRQAQLALTDLGKVLDKAKDDLKDLKDDFDKNTITLADGRKVYYDKDTNNFAYQDKQGKWHALKDDEDKAEAFEKAKARNGLVSTKQGQIALDKRGSQITDGHRFIQTQQQRLDQIDRDVKNGKLDRKDAIKQKRAITKETNDYKNEFSQEGVKLKRKVAPVEIRTQKDKADYKATHKTTGSLALADDKTKKLFGSDRPQDPDKSADLSITPKLG